RTDAGAEGVIDSNRTVGGSGGHRHADLVLRGKTPSGYRRARETDSGDIVGWAEVQAFNGHLRLTGFADGGKEVGDDGRPSEDEVIRGRGRAGRGGDGDLPGRRGRRNLG